MLTDLDVYLIVALTAPAVWIIVLMRMVSVLNSRMWILRQDHYLCAEEKHRLRNKIMRLEAQLEQGRRQRGVVQ